MEPASATLLLHILARGVETTERSTVIVFLLNLAELGKPSWLSTGARLAQEKANMRWNWVANLSSGYHRLRQPEATYGGTAMTDKRLLSSTSSTVGSLELSYNDLSTVTPLWCRQKAELFPLWPSVLSSPATSTPVDGTSELALEPWHDVVRHLSAGSSSLARMRRIRKKKKSISWRWTTLL